MCKLNIGELCKDNDCETYRLKCFKFYQEETTNGIKKVDCWDYKKNTLKPEDITMKANKFFDFICPECNHSFTIRIFDITKGRWCPYCTARNGKLCKDSECIICYNKSLASYKECINGIKKIDCWDYKKNSDTPRDVFLNSGLKRWFICSECKYEFNPQISHISRKNKPTWCKNCSMKKK